jgi:hypothetical protein
VPIGYAIVYEDFTVDVIARPGHLYIDIEFRMLLPARYRPGVVVVTTVAVNDRRLRLTVTPDPDGRCVLSAISYINVLDDIVSISFGLEMYNMSIEDNRSR